MQNEGRKSDSRCFGRFPHNSISRPSRDECGRLRPRQSITVVRAIQTCTGPTGPTPQLCACICDNKQRLHKCQALALRSTSADIFSLRPPGISVKSKKCTSKSKNGRRKIQQFCATEAQEAQISPIAAPCVQTHRSEMAPPP